MVVKLMIIIELFNRGLYFLNENCYYDSFNVLLAVCNIFLLKKLLEINGKVFKFKLCQTEFLCLLRCLEISFQSLQNHFQSEKKKDYFEKFRRVFEILFKFNLNAVDEIFTLAL